MFQIAAENLREEEKKLEELNLKKEGYEQQLRDCMNATLDMKKIKELRDGIEFTKDKIKQQKANVRKAEQKLEVARKRLEEAVKERKVHEILKENAFEEYKRAYEKEEQKAVDELISFQHAQKEGESD